MVRPGGRLVYATCSSEPDENDAVVASFIVTRPDFRVINLHSESNPVTAPFVDTLGFFRTTPPAHGLEAFFAALLTGPDWGAHGTIECSMPSRFGVWSVGRLLLLVCALGGTFLLFFGVALRVALRAREVQVPRSSARP